MSCRNDPESAGEEELSLLSRIIRFFQAGVGGLAALFVSQLEAVAGEIEV